MRRICNRCAGRGKVYRVGSGYSQVNMGGAEAKCPLCMGERFVDIEEVLAKSEKVKEDGKRKRRKAQSKAEGKTEEKDGASD